MTKKSKIPTFNMKVVVQETGLKPDTLRAWERRYGLPEPERTTGGHRLYSQFEIDRLKWLVTRQEEGMSISKAVDLWRQLEQEGKDPFDLSNKEKAAGPPVMPLSISGDMFNSLRQNWLEACLNFEEAKAQYILAQAFAMFPVETVCFEILQQSLTDLGEGWYQGRVTVQQEHFASELAIRQVEALLASIPTSNHNGQLLVACPPKELHTFGPLLLTLLLRRRSWEVVFLGADVPLERLAATVQAIQPNLVILVAQTLRTAGTLLAMADLLRRENVALAFGGGVFNRLEDTRVRIPGYFLGTDLRQAPDVVKEIVHSGKTLPEYEVVSARYVEALDHYRQKRAAIEAYVHRFINSDHLSSTYLDGINEDLGNNIIAALTLGNVDLLSADVKWVPGLLMHYHQHLPREAVSLYVNTYYEGIKHHLDDRGQLLQDWFERLTKNLTFLDGYYRSNGAK